MSPRLLTQPTKVRLWLAPEKGTICCMIVGTVLSVRHANIAIYAYCFC
jgi:hypothetical protein